MQVFIFFWGGGGLTRIFVSPEILVCFVFFNSWCDRRDWRRTFPVTSLGPGRYYIFDGHRPDIAQAQLVSWAVGFGWGGPRYCWLIPFHPYPWPGGSVHIRTYCGGTVSAYVCECVYTRQCALKMKRDGRRLVAGGWWWRRRRGRGPHSGARCVNIERCCRPVQSLDTLRSGNVALGPAIY